METEGKLRLADVFGSIRDPRQRKKARHDLVEVLVVAINGVLAGADTFVEIEAWANDKLDWFRQYLKLEHGTPSHDTLGRLFGLICPNEFEAAFRRWMGSVLPALGPAAVVAIDGKTSRRSGKVDATALHLVSAFAAGAGLVMGQTATAVKSNEITAIPLLLQTRPWRNHCVTSSPVSARPRQDRAYPQQICRNWSLRKSAPFGNASICWPTTWSAP